MSRDAQVPWERMWYVIGDNVSLFLSLSLFLYVADTPGHAHTETQSHNRGAKAWHGSDWSEKRSKGHKRDGKTGWWGGMRGVTWKSAWSFSI